jgi:hypothetical protein
VLRKKFLVRNPQSPPFSGIDFTREGNEMNTQKSNAAVSTVNPADRPPTTARAHDGVAA